MEENLERALRMFSHYGCNQQTLISKQKLTQILNRQATDHLRGGFSPQIIEEIWGQAETTSRGEATALTFAKIYAQAIVILDERVALIDGPTGTLHKEEQLITEQCKLADLEEDYEKGYIENYDRINTVRKNIVVIQKKIKELQKNREDFQKELDEMIICLQVEEKVGEKVIERSQIVQSRLQRSTEHETPSEDLSIIFKVAVFSICITLPFASYHPSFLPLLCYLLIIYWLFLGYYDQYFVKTLILGLVVSCIMDIIYVCLVFAENIGSYRFYNQETAWRYISIIFTGLQVALRVILMIKLSHFKEPNAKRQFFVLFGHQIELNTRSGKVFGRQDNRD